MKRVLVAGGAGYVGSQLVPTLLDSGYAVTVLDLYLYGESIFGTYHQHPHLIEIKGDIRDLRIVREALKGCHHVIHLACISNDPSFELNPSLGKSINLDAFGPFVKAANNAQIDRFIYASSSSVYGVKEVANVTEEMELEPLTDYSKFKAACEKILLEQASETMTPTIVRPATVCGYALRQRLDLVVNILTNLAYHTGKIKVMGGGQMRPNIHIHDMVRAYLHILKAPKEKIYREIFNVGHDNHTVLELGQMVEKIVGAKRPVSLHIEPTNDNRSYHVSSQKIGTQLGFMPLKSVEDAVRDLLEAFEKGNIPNALEDDRYFNIKTMKSVELV